MRKLSHQQALGLSSFSPTRRALSLSGNKSNWFKLLKHSALAHSTAISYPDFNLFFPIFHPASENWQLFIHSCTNALNIHLQSTLYIALNVEQQKATAQWGAVKGHFFNLNVWNALVPGCHGYAGHLTQTKWWRGLLSGVETDFCFE